MCVQYMQIRITYNTIARIEVVDAEDGSYYSISLHAMLLNTILQMASHLICYGGSIRQMSVADACQVYMYSKGSNQREAKSAGPTSQSL